MSAIPRYGSISKSALLSQIATHAFGDTVEIWFPPLRLAALRDISRYGRVVDCTNKRTGDVIGYRLIRNQPSKAWLRTADQLAAKRHGVLHRVDVALDTPPTPGLRELIVSSAVLKWSAKERMQDDHDTVYWLDLSKRRRRNLVLYDDKPSKVTRDLDCVHLELRLVGADVVRRQGLNKPSDLLRLNPKQLFDRHVKWSAAGANYVKNQMRKEHVKSRRCYASERVSPFLDQYLTDTPARVQYVMQRLGLDRSQNITAKDSAKRNKLSAPVAIPTALAWIEDLHSLRSLSNSKKAPHPCRLSLDKDMHAAKPSVGGPDTVSVINANNTPRSQRLCIPIPLQTNRSRSTQRVAHWQAATPDRVRESRRGVCPPKPLVRP